MANYAVSDTELVGVANAIRAKTGGSGLIVWPDGFSSGIAGIPTGGTVKTMSLVQTFELASIAGSGTAASQRSILTTPMMPDYIQGTPLMITTFDHAPQMGHAKGDFTVVPERIMVNNTSHELQVNVRTFNLTGATITGEYIRFTATIQYMGS